MTEPNLTPNQQKEELAVMRLALLLNGFEPFHPQDIARLIIKILKDEFGYQLPAGKAPLLTEKEIRHILIEAAPYDCNWEEITQGEMERYLIVSKAQNDVADKFYGGS